MSKSRTLAAALVSAFSIGALACDDDITGNDDQEWEASLTAAAERPAPTGSPTATGTASLELDGRMLSVSVNVSGNLTSDLVSAHIHGPAATADVIANIVLDFVPSMTTVINAGTRTGTIVNTTYDLDALTVSATGVLRVSADELIAMFNAGTAYVNVHTQTNPAGEIRGTITKD